MRNARYLLVAGILGTPLVVAFALSACGGAAIGSEGDAATNGDGSPGDRDGNASDQDGSRRDAESNGDVVQDDSGGGDAGCQTCDPGTQYCIHGDVTSGGASNVEECESKIGDCLDCSCYSQLGLCLEEGLPKSCTTVSGLIVVECAEIP